MRRNSHPRKHSNSKVTDTDISDEEYQHALKVFESFKCGTMRSYHNLYMMSMVTVYSNLFFSFSAVSLVLCYFSIFSLLLLL